MYDKHCQLFGYTQWAGSTFSAYTTLAILLLLLLLLLFQSALQTLWVLAYSTVIEYSQQEGFYRVPLPAARQTPQLGGPVIRTFQLPPQMSPSSGRWNYGREMAENFAESGDFITYGFFYVP
jgi:hypothetical protein